MAENEKIDPYQLGQLIRFNAHMLDIATRTKNPDVVKKNTEAEDLRHYLALWKEYNYPVTAWFLWAEKKHRIYNEWLSDRKMRVSRLQDKPLDLSDHELQRIIRERRSIRFWKKKSVPKEMIMKILEAGTYAPSAFNRLPWRFFIAETPVMEMQKGDASNPGMFVQAPVRIFVAVDERLFFEKYSGALDAGLAMQNMLLTAHALGLGSCLIYQGEFIDKQKLAEFYGIPDYCTVYCAILLGFPDEKPELPERMDVEEISVFLGKVPNPEF